MTSAPARREGLLAAITRLLPHLKLAAVPNVATSGGLPRSFSRRPPRTAAAGPSVKVPVFHTDHAVVHAVVHAVASIGIGELVHAMVKEEM